MRVRAGEAVRERRDRKRRSMGRHVPPVGDERDGPEEGAADDLGDHGHGREGDDEPGTALVPLVPLAEEDVLMPPALDGMMVHAVSLRPGPT